ncbi:glycosyltransferase [Leptolyngbya sp. Heron Island J]|uniref:hormogonium polysaccharide biosynthesis glycosyltransferase HpsP n=1 Tax=Leptolyngbya sp. Heron Island J TaxID=1385935 RepID=UPI0003B97962|nr:hormogonium polysaccharide biosynthesis glycosyltransferase HpsP [Leptolyngbya sp. Heron Island J]ESA34149.1 glycosyltransferase [Leptolyngbya sp. Heron Island J]
MAKALNILQIVPSISLVYGGPSQMVRGLSQALARQGANVTVLTTDANGDEGQAPLDVPLNQPVETDGYRTVYFRCSPFRRYKFSLQLLQWLNRYGADYDIAHIHALFSPVSSAAATVARWQQLPYILRPLGTLDPADLAKKKQFKQLYAALLERPNIQGAAALHFTSEQEARVSERFGVKTQDMVLPLGVTLPEITCNDAEAQQLIRQRYGIPADVPIVLFMSRLDPKKGLDLLLPALESLRQSNHSFHLILSGGNPQDQAYVEAIGQQIKDSVLADCTTITGFVSGELKLQILQAADLFVLPSYYENFGIAVAEAMMAGKPVVISDQVHIWQDIQGSQSGWVTGCEQRKLTQALAEALADDAERRQRGENGRGFAKENYGWDAIASRMIEHYRRLL